MRAVPSGADRLRDLLTRLETAAQQDADAVARVWDALDAYARDETPRGRRAEFELSSATELYRHVRRQLWALEEQVATARRELSEPARGRSGRAFAVKTTTGLAVIAAPTPAAALAHVRETRRVAVSEPEELELTREEFLELFPTGSSPELPLEIPPAGGGEGGGDA